MRQFNIIIFDENILRLKNFNPQLKDQALCWIKSNDWNNSIQNLDAPWTIFAHSLININKDFLDALANAIYEFPMVDAFSPTILCKDKSYNGLLINKNGLATLPINSPMRFIATPTNALAVFSTRIIQRTGSFDIDLPKNFRLIDYALRMAHAGGKMFYLPALFAYASENFQEQNAQQITEKINAQWQIIYKSLPLKILFKFMLNNPKTFANLLHTKNIKLKRNKATILSKLSTEYLAQISV